MKKPITFEKTCQALMRRGWHDVQCSRRAVIDEYCTQHHPDNVAARAKERAERERDELRLLKLRFYGPQFKDTLQQIANGAPNPIELAQHALRNLKE